MSIFLDTSVLLKLYFPEDDSTAYQAQSDAAGGSIFLSTLSKIEFASAGMKKVLTRAMSSADSAQRLALFAEDGFLFQWIPLTDAVLASAVPLIMQYPGLRTLDAIQLACALQVRNKASLFLTADQRLASIFEAEGLPTQ